MPTGTVIMEPEDDRGAALGQDGAGDSAGGRVNAAGDGLVVRDVTVRAVVVPLRRPLATRVGDFPRWPLLLIDVSTEQGIVGRSYLAPYLDRAAAVLLPAIRDLGAGLRGRPVTPAAAYRKLAGGSVWPGIRALRWRRWPGLTLRCGMR